MNISIHVHYKIKHIYTYSFLSFDYDDLYTETKTEEFKMNGAEFLEKVVAKSIQNREFSIIVFGENFVIVFSLTL